MNIAILTKRDFLFCSLSECLDELIAKRRIQNMDLYSFVSPLPETLKEALHTCTCWLIFLDATSYPEWQSILADFSQTSPYLLFCVISEDYRVAAELLNIQLPSRIAGYINPVSDCIKTTCQALLERLRTFPAVNSGILMRGRGTENVIPFSEIYYIDTEKGTHLCNFHHTEGTHTMRANIYSLSQQLDWRFCPVRASTIANLSLIRHMDMQNHLLYFTPDIFCSFSRSNRKFLNHYFNLQ